MNARLTDAELMQVLDPITAAQIQQEHERAAAARNAAFEATAKMRENEKLALFTKRLVAGEPLRRYADEQCAALLLKSAKPEALEALTALLKVRRT